MTRKGDDSRRMIRGGLVLSVASLAAGCSAWRPIAPLSTDEQGEMASLATRSSDRTFRVVAGGRTREESAEFGREALRSAGLRVVEADATTNIEVRGPEYPWPPIADLEGESLFFILTIGLYPQTTSHAERWTLRVLDCTGADAVTTCDLTRPEVFGWLAIPARALPGWTLQWGHAPYSPTEAELSARPARLGLLFARAVADASPPVLLEAK